MIYVASSVAVIRQKGHRHAGQGALHFPRTIREQDGASTPGVETRRRRGSARTAAHFCRPREPIRVLVRLHPRLPPPCIIHLLVFVTMVVLFCFFVLCETTKATTTKQRSTKEGALMPLYGREKRFQSKKGRSAPHIPPVVSAGLGATEPLRGSTIRGFSGAQRERRRRKVENTRRRERRE